MQILVQDFFNKSYITEAGMLGNLSELLSCAQKEQGRGCSQINWLILPVTEKNDTSWFTPKQIHWS